MSLYSPIIKPVKGKVNLLLLSFMMPLISLAQNTGDSAAVADTNINKTTRMVLQEGAKMTSTTKNTLLSLLMIILVLGVVALALWLSFRSPNTAEKRNKVIERQQKRKH